MRPRSLQGFDPAVALVAVLLAINLVAVLGLISARRDVHAAIRDQLELETSTDARNFETLLAQQHSDLSFLAQTPPLATLHAGAAADDPVARRWTRLDVEASLLLFLQSSPAVRRLEAESEVAGVHVVAERSGGVPQLATPDAPPPGEPALLSAAWPIGGGGRLTAWVDPAPLLATAGPGLRLHARAPEAENAASETVRSGLWTPALVGWVERTETDQRLTGAVERLAGRYQLTLLLNVALMPLSLLLGALTLRRVRRLARLESAQAQQARLQTLERQVQHADRLASLGRFAAGIAHEINNPLEGMVNYLELLREDLEGGRAESARGWLPRLREGIDRAAGVVRQVLAFAQPGRGSRQPLDLAEVLARTETFLRGHPDCREVTITIRCPESLPLAGDGQTIGQLVLNLVLNACQAQNGSGTVELVARRDGESVELCVLDRGPGFPPARRERWLEPFESTRGSLGLGLAVCQSIVLEHGGSIEIDDRADGPGAEVRVSLPAAGSLPEILQPVLAEPAGTVPRGAP